MPEFSILTFLRNKDVAGLVGLGEEKALAEIIEVLEYRASAEIFSSTDIFYLGRFLAEARLLDIDRGLLIWSLSAPSSFRFGEIMSIIPDMWRSGVFWRRVDRERMTLLLRLREAVIRDDVFERGEERFLKTIARLLDQGEGLPLETQALVIETMLALPWQGFSSINAEETYLIQCAPRLRARGIKPPTGYASFFAHLR